MHRRREMLLGVILLTSFLLVHAPDARESRGGRSAPGFCVQHSRRLGLAGGYSHHERKSDASPLVLAPTAWLAVMVDGLR
jgi:hypothetical protein